ncbi:MAG: hypothetical protein COA33_005410 [Fluviicola sp.]|nr:hypothetical protein [Fluviicola sp.]
MRSLLLLGLVFSIFQLTAQKIVPVRTEILNYENTEEVLKLEKLEIGINLPTYIRNRVENFTQKRRGPVINPYLEWELKVTVEFTPPNGLESIFVHAFYSRDYSSHMSPSLPTPANRNSYTDQEYAALGGWVESPTEYNFRVRFSPNNTGEWSYKIHIKTKDHSFVTSQKSFEVVASDNKGYVSVGENQRFFELDSQSFFPIGGNAPWPATYKFLDPEFAKLSNYKGTPFPEEYRGVTAVPRVYSVYKDLLKKMGSNGVNMVRMIMYPSSTDIEWEKLGDYTDRLKLASELDDILEVAEENGIYLLWNLQIHYSFQESVEAYYKSWAWDSKIKGQPFCYRELINSDNPLDFFSHEEAKKYYKQRLRYIISRWGYSTNIAIFELFSEINNVVKLGPDLSPSEKTNKTEKNWQLLTAWQKEMGDYINTLYNGRTHLQSASYAGDKFQEDTVFVGEPFDVMSLNNYDFHAPSFGYFWVWSVAERHLNEANEYSYIKAISQDKREVKPLIYSETGIPSVTRLCDSNGIEIKRHLYQSTFSGVAGAFEWDLWFLDDHTNYAKINAFISDYELDKNNWHPGAMELMAVENELPGWEYRNSYAARMEGNNGLADLSYLRSGNKQEAIGVITNKSYNVYTVLDCFDKEWDEKIGLPGWQEGQITELQKVKTFGRKGENLRLKGMKKTGYVIEYFLPNDLENSIHTSRGRGSNVKIKAIIGDSFEEYIVLFKVVTKKSLRKERIKKRSH